MAEPSIAIIGLGCRYPDADSPTELWENVLAQRRAFRRMPAERLRLEDYSPDAGLADSITAARVAVLEGFEFDRVRFRTAGTTFREVDLAHWLALDVATQALGDAGFPDGAGLPRDTTGVIVGNTLTGEFSRAHLMRLRWPYVRRVVDAELANDGWEPARRAEFLKALEGRYKSPFAPPGGETLAGGLSNTIAGRICNHYDLHGGGYTVDGACASSLLAVTTACTALAAGDLDVALAGGVDLSLDPFELVGFSRVGVLARDEMRVYDARPTGFWPGEGCGFVVLERSEDARARGHRVYGTIRGWGVASDGSGGTTRPEVAGQLLALNRTYRRAGFDASTVGYFEGHGTGTEVGDPVELDAIHRARGHRSDGPRAAIGSIKANIGHTKAAAGIAGVIKAALSLHAQIVPPIPGRHQPHPRFADREFGLRTARRAEPWPESAPLRAAVSAMGFGGIDTHVVIEATAAERKLVLTREESLLAATPQDAELFVFASTNADGLRREIERVRAVAARLSLAELTDVAVELHRALGPGNRRAAVVASTPEELLARLDTIVAWLAEGAESTVDAAHRAYLGPRLSGAPRVGFLFPGQGSPSHVSGGIWRRRFDALRPLYESMPSAPAGDTVATEIAQPAIVTNSLAGLRQIEALGIRAGVAVGHSLGEIAALHWGGGFDRDELVRIATARGHAMAQLADANGAMASVNAPAEDVQRWIDARSVVISGINGPHQTVIAGGALAIDEVVARVRAQGIGATKLAVSHAFHSPLVAPAVPALRAHLDGERFHALQGRVISTILGVELPRDTDLKELLCRQVTEPVRFVEAVRLAERDVDVWIEVGPGRTLSRLVADIGTVPSIALDAGSESVAGLLSAAGLVWSLGGDVELESLFAGRFARPFDCDRPLRFLASPCEQAPLPTPEERRAPDEDSATRTPTARVEAAARVVTHAGAASGPEIPARSALDVVRELVATQVELPISAVADHDRLLADLHLNSITVGQLAVETARRLGLPVPVDPLSFAGATVAEMARAIAQTKAGDAPRRAVEGVGPWVRPFVVQLAVRSRPVRPRPEGSSEWTVLGPDDHPLADRVANALRDRGAGCGIVVCLSPEPGLDDIDRLLDGAQRALRHPGARFVVVHQGGGGAFARCLHAEFPDVTTCVVEAPFDHPDVIDWVIAESEVAIGHHEAVYDRAGRRHEPVLTLLANLPPDPLRFASGDVLLVTGGGKGIAAECALALGRAEGLRLGILGRSRPEADPALTSNLARLTAAGIPFHYVAADVTDASAVREAVREIEGRLGTVVAFLHGAGVNEPRPLGSLTRAIAAQTLAPKLDGARNVLAAVDAGKLRLFVAFGSIIARTGLRGEADYGLANEWLTRFVEQFSEQHPACRCLAVEWSVWSGVGMGESLGSLDALRREGITPISPEVGVAMLGRLIHSALPSPSVVVAGRIGDRPILTLGGAPLPLLRFVGRTSIHVPGVELIVEIEISPESDPYLADHVYEGVMLLPGVVGLEAMAQVAMAAIGATRVPTFERVSFRRPVTVRAGEPCGLRIAALVAEDGSVDVVLRTSDSGHLVDHFQARCRFEDTPPAPRSIESLFVPANGVLPLQPERDLYGDRLFQTGRFRRVRQYRVLRATECLAEIANGDAASEWFGPYYPADLVLGDAGARDAAIHCIQACIPHATVLPTAVARITTGNLDTGGPWTVHAVERSHEGDRFVYDLEIAGADGLVRERWEGLELRAMPRATRTTAWPWPLLAPYVERRVGDLIPGGSVRIALAPNGHARNGDDTTAALQTAFGRVVSLNRDPNGRPEVASEPAVAVAASHAGRLTLAIGGTGPLGCDLQHVETRPPDEWRDLLGLGHFELAERIACESSKDLGDAATRVWSSLECLRKAGWIGGAPLTIAEVASDGWIVLASGALRIATYAAPLEADELPTVVAVLKRRDDAGL